MNRLKILKCNNILINKNVNKQLSIKAHNLKKIKEEEYKYQVNKISYENLKDFDKNDK